MLILFSKTLSTDDFGTGCSSLSYLHKYPFQRLKSDWSFVSKLEDEKSAAIIKTILLLGQNLNIEVVAEGIEIESQLNKLTEIGCELGQGYLFSKPIDVPTAESLLQNGLEYLKKYEYSRLIEGVLMEIENIQ